MYKYNGEYAFNKQNITNWNSRVTGVYYLFQGGKVVYVGSATGLDGIRGRLLQHINERSYPYVTQFGYKQIISESEALLHESAEIKRLQPMYNKVGKRLWNTN